MILAAYTILHVLISLVAILSGLVVLHGMLTGHRRDGWTKFFLTMTIATSFTGFFFPFHGFTPALGTGILSMIILGVAIYARYARRLAGGWRKAYVITAVFALYLNVFVLVVQAFLRVPALKALAPRQSEPPFVAAQMGALAAFVVLGIAATIRFRPGAPDFTSKTQPAFIQPDMISD